MTISKHEHSFSNFAKGYVGKYRWQWRRTWSADQCVLQITTTSGSETILTVDRTPAHRHAILMDGVEVTEADLDADIAVLWTYMVQHWG
jgi:hypothetical protein